jgi:hypothetical protein
MHNRSKSDVVPRRARHLICLTAACAVLSQNYTQAGEISGTAYEKNGPGTIPGVAVQLFRDNSKVDEENTGSDGRYTVHFSDQGKYRITFTKLPDRCIAPYVDEDFKNASDTKQENVYVYPKDEKISYGLLFEALQKRTTPSGDTAKAADDIVALTTTGIDTNTLVEVGIKIAAQHPSLVAPITGRVTDFEEKALIVDTASSTPLRINTTYPIKFVDPSGQLIPADTPFWARPSLSSARATAPPGP